MQNYKHFINKSTKEFVTITKTGRLGLNKAFTINNGLRVYEYAILNYDDGVLTLKLTRAKLTGSLRVYYPSSSGGIGSTSFLAANNIQFTGKRYTPEIIEKTDDYCIVKIEVDNEQTQ